VDGRGIDEGLEAGESYLCEPHAKNNNVNFECEGTRAGE
jgi:hypothetical protein